MRRLGWFIALVLGLFYAAPAFAQIQIVHRAPNCDLSQKSYENFLSDKAHWYAPRYQIHAVSFAIPLVAGEALHQATGWSRRATYLTTGLLIAFVPHIRQVIQEAPGQRTINARDWAFDASTRLAAAILVSSRNKPLAVATVVASYAALVCYGSP